jgi:Flp pilus assembly protein TadD
MKPWPVLAWDLHVVGWMRTGEFRICPRCKTRNKATEPNCVQCGRPLFSIPLARTTSSSDEMAESLRGRSWTRGVMVAGVLLACAFGLIVRKTFRGASLDPTATTAVASASDTAPAAPSPSLATPAPPTSRDFERGRELLQKGDAQGALRALTPVAQAEPDNAVIAYTYGKALWAAGSRDRAVMQLERAARIDPYATVYRVDLAKALAASRRTREAIREYEAAVSLDPGNADNVTALAALYARAGDSAESRALLERAATLKPGDVEIGQRLADLDARQATSYAPSGPSAVSASSSVSATSAASAPSAPSAVSAGVVYTIEDLRRAGGGRTPGAVPPQPPPPVVRAQELGETEAHWRDKAAERREAVRSAEQRVAALKAQVDQLQRQAAQTSADGDSGREMAKAQDDLESAQERLAKAHRRMEELQDEARRKGLPPDWLR